MKCFPKLLSTIGLAVIFSLPLSIQAVSGTLSGTVIDNVYFNPVPEVEIAVFHSDSLPAGNDVTGSDGTYSITLDAGEYYAVFSKTNYADTAISDITITPDGTTTVDLTFRFVFNCSYIVGDVNGSNSLNGLDVTYGVAYFKGGPAPLGCLCECTPGHIWYVCGEANGDCAYNGFDITYLVAMYPGGPLAIPCPDCPPAD
jgi:hypothetical protein